MLSSLLYIPTAVISYLNLCFFDINGLEINVNKLTNYDKQEYNLMLGNLIKDIEFMVNLNCDEGFILEKLEPYASNLEHIAENSNLKSSFLKEISQFSQLTDYSPSQKMKAY
jgi:hypothetical protein